MILEVPCTEEIKENQLKKLRSLISSLSSEITNEIYETNIDKLNIFEIFLMDFNEIDENFNIFIQNELIKVAKVLNWNMNKIRINFQVKTIDFYIIYYFIYKNIVTDNFEFLRFKKPIKTFNLQDFSKERYFLNKERMYTEKFNIVRLFIWNSNDKAYFMSV